MQVKYASLRAMRQIYPATVEGGVDFYKLLAARDSLLLEPPTYQIEAGCVHFTFHTCWML